MKQPCIYILANKPRGTIYIGVTSDLIARAWQHKNDLVTSFSEKYQVHMLVYIHKFLINFRPIPSKWIPAFAGMMDV